MSSQSERIRAVLARSEAPRSNGEAAPPTIAVNTDNLEALLRSQPKTSQPVMEEPVAEVEEFLPLITASDETRATIATTPAAARSTTPAAAPSFATASVKKRSGVPPIYLVFGGLAALVVVAAVLVFVMKDRLFPAPEPAAAVPVTQGSGFPLQLQAEPQGNGLIDVRWNPQSAAVSQARDGRMIITELNQEPRVVDLTPEQLRIGHLSYQSQAERLEFRLEVTDGSGSTARESALALSSNAIPAVPVGLPPAVAKAPDPLEPARPEPRPFIPPVPSQKSAPETRALVLDPPPAAIPIGSTAAPGADVRQTLTNLPAPPLKQAPPPAQTIPQPIRRGGVVQAPALINKVAPVYPQLAKIGRIEGNVQFVATIGKDGKVHNLQLVSGPQALIEAARDAVKQWIYRPSMLNGEPLEVTTQIDVNFTLGR